MKLPEEFGENVFNDSVQKDTLPSEVYKALRATIETGKRLDVSIAGAVASAMKKWAISKGATHYSHWFQPLTGLTAEKLLISSLRLNSTRRRARSTTLTLRRSTTARPKRSTTASTLRLREERCTIRLLQT